MKRSHAGSYMCTDSTFPTLVALSLRLLDQKLGIQERSKVLQLFNVWQYQLCSKVTDCKVLYLLFKATFIFDVLLVIKQAQGNLLKIISENNFVKFQKDESLGYQSGTYEDYRIFERVAE